MTLIRHTWSMEEDILPSLPPAVAQPGDGVLLGLISAVTLIALLFWG